MLNNCDNSYSVRQTKSNFLENLLGIYFKDLLVKDLNEGSLYWNQRLNGANNLKVNFKHKKNRVSNFIFIFSYLNITDDEDYNDAAYFLIEVHDDLEEPKEQLGIEMERVNKILNLNY